jgi:hypothetical protein
MTEAERIADDLGEGGHRRMMKHVVLSNQTLPLAYNAVVHDGVVAKRSADSGEKHEPASDIDTAVVDSLKALDPNRPIREADIAKRCHFKPIASSKADLTCAGCP